MSQAAAIDSLSSQLQSLLVVTKNDEAARKQLFHITMGAAMQFESPLDTCWRIIMSPHAPAAIMTLLNMGAIDQLAKSTTSMSAQRIAEATKADALLIVRLLRPLVQLGIVREVDEETYEATRTTKILTDPVLKGGFNFMFTAASHSLSQMPFYLQQTGYKNVDRAPEPFQYTKNTQDDLFPWLFKDPALMAHFDAFMSGQQALRGDWFDRLPVDDMILSGAVQDPNAVLLVDIGGGEGHDVQAFHRGFPSTPGKLVLQDLPPVIQNSKQLDSTIVCQVYDFFTPQPIKGARVYYLRSILHDWSNDKCLEVLSHIREAMEPGYSRLLLNEFILPAKNVPLYPALLDINMMALLNGMERTEKQWTRLLDEAGFKVVKFHVDPNGESEGIVEAVLQ